MSDSNFEFLKDEYPSIASLGVLAEKSLYDDPSNTLSKLRIIGEKLTLFMLEYEHFSNYEYKDQFTRLKLLKGDADIPSEVIDMLHSIRKSGNKASHTGGGTFAEAKLMLRNVFQLCLWFYETYEEEDLNIDYSVPVDEDALDDARIAELEALVQSQEDELTVLEQKIKHLTTLSDEQKNEQLERSHKAAIKNIDVENQEG